MAHAFHRSLAEQLQAQAAATWRGELPPYDFSRSDARGPAAELASDSEIRSFRLGTGASVFASALLPALLEARHEIILVTCFWAPSKSLDGLSATLTKLAAVRKERRQQKPWRQSVLRVRICLSSRSLMQKLLHTASPDGYVYPTEAWTSQLGLPAADALREAGIDLAVKSLFFRPLSVMHPKLVLVDRRRAFLPSCNVSWESWLECCVEITGAAVQPLLSFYARTWGDELPPLDGLSDVDGIVRAGRADRADRADSADNADNADSAGSADSADGKISTTGTQPTTFSLSPLDIDGPGSIVVRFRPEAAPIPTVILPSSHHRNPSFRPFPWQHPPPPPPTPLNLALLQLFASARKHIFIQTPNVTAEPAVAALLQALARGVDVDVVTGRDMMVLEQLVTAGTTTARCLRDWTRRYEMLQAETSCGKLRTWHFHPLQRASATTRRVFAGDEEQAILPETTTAATATTAETNDSGFIIDAEEPVQSHVKLVIVDGEYTVLGSGNMDRASWFTSQELGILFHDAAFASAVQTAVDRVLDGRLMSAYPP